MTTNNDYLSSARREFIRAKVRQIHWMMRKSLCKSGSVANSNYAEMLDPAKALYLLGYKVETMIREDWQEGDRFQVAGLLDRSLKTAFISNSQTIPSQLFTLAHELGHVVLHPHMEVQHRDRPMNQLLRSSSVMEKEANYFASEFLVPKTLLGIEFEKRFGSYPFSLDEQTAFLLYSCQLEKVQSKARTPRDLAKLLAEAHRFNSKSFESLKSHFGVSSEMMAIHLEHYGFIANF